MSDTNERVPVLLVEDDDLAGEAYAEALAIEGCIVDWVRGSAAAIEPLRRSKRPRRYH